MAEQRLQATIPQDWQESDGYCLLQVCVPNSLEWIVAVKSAIHSLARGRYWRADGPRKAIDPNAVEIVDAQAITREIHESICVTCLDDIKALHHQQIQANLLLYSALTRTQVNLDLDTNPVINQFGDADANHTAASPFWTTLNETWVSYNFADVIFHTFNKPFTLFPDIDGISTFFELVNTLDGHVVNVNNNLDRIHDAIVNRLNRLINKLHNLFTLSRPDIDFLTEGFNITTLLATSLTDYDDRFPGIWDWIKSILSGDASVGNPRSLFKTVDTPAGMLTPATYKSITKVIDEKEAGGTTLSNIDQSLSKLLEVHKRFDISPQPVPATDSYKNSRIYQVLDLQAKHQSDSKFQLDRIADTLEQWPNTQPPTVNVTNNVPTPTVNVTNSIDFTEIVGKLGGIVNAIDRLAAKPNEGWNSDNIQQLMDTLADLSIQAVAVSGEGNVVLSDGCCPDNVTKPKPADPKPTKPTYLPIITKPTDLYKPIDEYHPDPCKPINTSWLIDVMEFFIGIIDTIEDTFGADAARWAAVPVLTALALIPGVSGTLSGLGLIVATPNIPIVDEVAVTVAGWAVTAYVIYIFMNLGIEGLRIFVDWIKYDYSLWTALECGESTLGWDEVIDLLTFGLFKYLDGIVTVKRIRKTGKTSEEVKQFFSDGLKQLYREEVKRLPGKSRIK